jgi:NADH dehydrogenase FAD-containing subunit
MLVNRENFFLFTPMLHEVAAADLDLTNIVTPVRKLLRKVDFFEGEVEAIDLAKRAVTVLTVSSGTPMRLNSTSSFWVLDRGQTSSTFRD